MKTFVILFISLLSVSIQAQNVIGFVFSSEDNQAIESANVAVLNPNDSATIVGAISNSRGKFKIENINAGNYLLRISYLGFNSYSKNISISNSRRYNADTIFLKPMAEKLEEAVVVGDKIRGTELVDRTVYSIPSEVVKTSVTGYDVLQKIPSVQVDFNNNVTLNGSSNFIIQVDGKQRDKEYLNRIQAGDIESIEIISNPSGKYDGTIDGVINIKLKPEARKGFGGMAGTMIRPSEKPLAVLHASLDYGFEKITYYVSGYAYLQKLTSYTSNFSRFNPELSISDSIINLDGTGDFSMSANSINAGFDYYINKYNTISFNTNFKPNIFESSSKDEGTLYQKTGMEINQYTLNNIDNRSNEYNTSLFYKKEFKKPIQEFTFESVLYFFNSTAENNFNSTKITFPTPEYNFREESNINKRYYYTAKADYVHPLGISGKFETGYHFYYQEMDYDFLSSDSLLSNRYKYHEFRNSIYVGLNWNLSKFGFHATLRGEYSNIDVTEDYLSEYLTLLPAANIQYKFSSKQNIKFTYNRRITRPNIDNLNPFIKLNDNFSFSQGNPLLKPEYREKLQLKYTLNFGKNHFSPYMYYEFKKHKIGNTNTLFESPFNGDQAILSSPRNILTGNEQGIGVNAMLWFVKLNGRYYKGHYNEYIEKNVTIIEAQDYSSYSLTTMAFAPMKNDYTAFAFLFYNGVNTNAQSKTYNAPIYGLGGQKIFNKKHTLALVYVLPFSKTIEFQKTITETPSLYYRNSMGFDVSYYFQIQYAYNFNKGKKVKKLKRDIDIESDSKKEGFDL